MPETRSKKRQLDPPPPPPAPAKRATRRTSKQSASNPKEEPHQAAGPSQPAPAPPKRARRSTRSAAARGSPVQASPKRDEDPGLVAAPAQEEQALPKQEEAQPAGLPPRPSAQNKSSEAEEEPDMAGRQPGRGEDGEDDMARHLTSANTALQGLLRKLGAGFDEAFLSSMGGMSGGRFKNIISDLRQAEDEGTQLNALTELCELLAISSEDNLTTFPVETAVPLLVQSLNAEHNPDIMLLAARALTFLADMMPQSCNSIVRHGAVASFCQRLLTIEYIDLAEQSLLALEKLSHEHAYALLQNGGLLAVLSYLDFFPTGVQRVAVGTAANMCRGLTSENAGAVQEAVPILTNLLQYPDAKVVDNACLALSHIAESYSTKPHLLGMLSSGGLIEQALQLVALTENGTCTSQLSLGTYYSLVKLLCTCSSKAPAVAEQLLRGQLMGVLHTLIATSSLLPSASPGDTTAVLRSPDQLHEVLSLLCELLPPVPSPSTMVLEEQPLDNLLGGAASSKDARSQYFQANPQAAQEAVAQMVPVMLQLHSATVMPHVRQQCLNVLLRLLAMSSSAQLSEALRNVSISSFVASLLSARDSATQAAALLMAETLMAKLPNIFRAQFLKEGVLQALRLLVERGQASVRPSPAPSPVGVVAPAAAAAQGEGEAPVAETSSSRRVTRSNTRQRDSQSGNGMPAPSSARGASPPARKQGTAGAAASQAARNPFGVSPLASGEGGSNRGMQGMASASAAAAAAAGASLTAAAAGTGSSGQMGGKLSARASAFCQQHFGGQGTALETAGIKKLRDACAALCQRPEAVQELLQLLSESAPTDGGDVSVVMAGDGAEDDGGISVFELVNSGVVKALIDFLKGADLPTGSAHKTALLARLRSFVRTALAADSGTHPPLAAVLRKLQAALACAESFPVLLSRVAPPPSSGRLGSSASVSAPSAAANGLGSYRSGLAALARPFKLRLCRHSGEKTLKDYGSNVVLIEPLASMSTIEDFLYPRVAGGASMSPTAIAAEAAEMARAAAARGEAAGSKDAAGSRERSKSLEPGAAALAGSSGGAAGRTASVPAPIAASKAQPIPEDKGNRRMTRAAARAAAGNLEEPAVGDDEDEDGDAHMAHADEDRPLEEGEMPGAEGLFEEEDDEEDYDEELDGDDDPDHDMDIGPMQVHDLHVDDVMAAAQGTSTAAAAAMRQASAPPGSVAAAAASPATRLSSASGASAGAAAVSTAAAAAAAAAARAPSAWGTGRGGAGASSSAAEVPAAVRAEQPRLVFFSGTHKLVSATTVFQAIQQQSLSRASNSDAAEGAEEGTRDRQMWDGVHTLHYRTATAADATPPPGAGSASASPAPAAPASTTATAAAAGLKLPSTETDLPLGAAMPVQQVQSVSLPGDLTAEPACRDLMELIKLLEVLNRLGPRLCTAVEDEEEATATSQQPLLPQRGRAGAVVVGAACSTGIVAAAEDRPAYGRVPRGEFVCSKLASKLSQQLKDVLSICGGGLPAWCQQLAFNCKHLVPFEVRRRHFYCTALGLGRALQHMQALHSAEAGGAPVQSGSASEREMRVGRLQRQKVRVSRKRILESAIKVMELYASQRAVLELEYFGEVGTGLGPTLEFYTLLSHDLQRRNLRLWRHEDAAQPAGSEDRAASIVLDGSWRVHHLDAPAPAEPLLGPIAAAAGGVRSLANGQPSVAMQSHVEPWHDDTQYVNAPFGLFPAPLAGSGAKSAKVLDMFKLLGRAMAKALQDNRLMDLPLNYAFYRAVLGVPLDMYDIASFDPGLGHQLQKMWNALVAARANAGAPAPVKEAPPVAVAAKASAASRKRSSSSGKAAPAPAAPAPVTPAAAVMVDGVAIEDLCLTFTLPGYPEYELKPGGADLMVDSSNLGAWIQAVVDATLGTGIAQQLEAFTAGFNEVFPLSHLEAFYEDEVEALLCGAGEAWTVTGLAKAIKFDHGYSPASPVVLALLEVLSELDATDQKRFLRFVTGCPRLPPGGLAALQPRLTVVRKHPSGEKSGAGPTPVGSLRDAPAGSGTPLADGDLPSVMTCANYIKLPPYSCKQVLKERLLFAVREGQGSFDLS